MRRIFTLLIICSLAICSDAQTQQGVVKTKGRMVNGKHVAGQGLSGATVTIQGRSAVLSQASGAFSFPVTNKSFMVQGVKKQGYQLVDADATRKSYQYSPNTFYILMETPDQQQADKVAAERKLRRTLQQQLQKREDEIDAMKVSLEEKNRLLAELYKQQENNEKLIAEMAQEYAQMDYDQMDELNRQISDAILNGELTKADSLLRSKGDMGSRDAEITRRLEAEAKRKEELARQQEELAASEEGTRKLLEDFAKDCYNYYSMYKLENRHDSAAYYIELRANRDTTNAEWQFDAAYYLQKQNQYKTAAIYYERTLSIYRRLADSNPQVYEPDVAMTLNNLAVLYSDTQRLSESEEMYKEALAIRRRLAESNPQAHEPDVAMTLNNLAIQYKDTQRFSESEELYREALNIYRHLADSNSQVYEPDVAMTLNNLAILYSDTQRFSESEEMYKEALEIYRRLAEANPQAHEPNLAVTLNNLANLYKDTQRLSESEEMYKEALVIRRRLAESNPQAHDPDVARTLNNLAILYRKNQRFSESEEMYKETLAIRRRLAQDNPQVYEPDVASTLGNMSFLAIFMKRYAEAEQLATECLAVDSTQYWIASNLAAALLFQGRYAEAEKVYCQYKDELKEDILDDFKQFAEAGVIPPECEADVEKIKRMLEE